MDHVGHVRAPCSCSLNGSLLSLGERKGREASTTAQRRIGEFACGGLVDAGRHCYIPSLREVSAPQCGCARKRQPSHRRLTGQGPSRGSYKVGRGGTSVRNPLGFHGTRGMLGRVTKYRVKNDAPSEVFEAASEQERKDRLLLSYAERVEKTLDVKAVRSGGGHKNELVFDLVGVDASIANALRRILLAEVATVAIEHVYMFMNSSIIHDEILAHRLGLIPIMANPRMFEFVGEEGGEQDEPTEFNTCVFKLEVKNPADAADMPDPMPTGTSYAAGPRRTMNVFSGAMEWCPHGDQVERFKGEGGLRPVHDDILIAKLRPGQEIVAEMHCRKGIGKDHAKFSPVATASYRLLPVVTLKEEVEGQEAEELVAKCPLNVFDIEDLGGAGKRAKVARPRDCTMCRECIREPGWSDKVSLSRVADHFIFGIESVGMLPPKELLKDSVQVLRQKCDSMIAEVEAFESGVDFDEAMP